jgi:hypothetical protein
MRLIQRRAITISTLQCSVMRRLNEESFYDGVVVMVYVVADRSFCESSVLLFWQQEKI